MKITNADRKDLVGLALQIFMSFAATVGSSVTLFFAMSLFSWFHAIHGGVAYLVLLFGAPICGVGGAFLSWRLYRFYNEEQAHRRSVTESIPYSDALLPDFVTRYGLDFMFLVSIFGLLNSMMDYENLFAFWFTGALLAIVFVAGCVVMAKVAIDSRRWYLERVSTQGPWIRPMLPPYHD